MVQKFSLDVEMNKILSSNAYKQHSKPLSKKASAEDLKSAEILSCLKDLHDVCEALGEDESASSAKEKCMKCIKDLVACCKSDEILAWAEKHGYAEEAKEEKEEDASESEEESEEEEEDSSKADDSFAFEVSLT